MFNIISRLKIFLNDFSKEARATEAVRHAQVDHSSGISLLKQS